MDDWAFAFDDDVFEGGQERTIVSTAPEAYTAKQDTDGWFHSFSSFEDVMRERHGPNQLKHAIEHDYLYKRYDKALEGALAYIRMAETKETKVSNTREMSEIATHCAAKLQQWDTVERLLDRKQTTMELGSLLVKGRFYPACGRHKDALAALVEYHKHRKNDYNAWALMADVFASSSQYDLAYAAIQRALGIMTSSHWKTGADFVQQRFERDLARLQKQAAHIAECGGTDKRWASEHDMPGQDIYQLEDLAWMHSNLITETEQDDQEDIKPVREL